MFHKGDRVVIVDHKKKKDFIGIKGTVVAGDLINDMGVVFDRPMGGHKIFDADREGCSWYFEFGDSAANVITAGNVTIKKIKSTKNNYW